MLTAGIDDVTGTAANDTIVGVSDGVTSTTVGAGQPVTETFGGLDVIDGGEGTDTLKLTNTEGTMTLDTSVTVSNVENLVLTSAQNDITADVQAWTGLETVTVDQKGAADNVRITTQANVSSINVTAGTAAAAHDSDGPGADAADSVMTITDNGTATTDALESVSVSGALGAINIASDALANLTLTDSAVVATVTNTTVAHTLNVTANEQTGAAEVIDATAGTVNVTASGEESTGFQVTAAAATAINFAGDQDMTATLGAQAANLAITSTNSADLTITTALDTDVTFTGGAGNESITLGASTKATTMGAGDDTVTLNVAALGAGGSIDAGEGTDTLSMSAADAETASAGTTFEASISNFEKVELGVAADNQTNTVNLANLDDISYVVSQGTAAGTAAGGTAEVATVTFNGLLNGQSVTVGGQTYLNNTGADLTAAQVATNFAAATAISDGTGNYAEAVNGATVTYTASVNGDVADVTASATNSTAATLGAATTTDGQAAVPAATETATVTFADIADGQTIIIDGITVTATGGSATAIDIASAFISGATVGNAVVSGADGGAWGGAAGSSLNEVVFTSATPNTNVVDIAIGGTAAAPAVVTADGDAGAAGQTETADVTFTALNSGESVLVAGRTVTANGGNLTAAQVEAAYLGGVNTGNAVVGGTLAGWTVADTGTATDGVLRFTSTTANTDVADIDAAAYGVQAATAPTAPAVSVVDGTATGPAGNLTVTNMANDGTLELTGANNGTTTVTMKDATGTADSLNLKLNGAVNLAAGAVVVAGVESINIEATDSTAAVGANPNNPTAASTLQLNAAAATSITLSGNHGVDFTGSTVTNVTTLDASGVVANTGNPNGNLTDAQVIANDGVAGAVTFTTAVTDEDVTITTGNGNDVINAASVGTAANSTNTATISTGAGRDTIFGGADSDTIDAGSENDTVISSTGADSITLGAGNDTYVLRFATDSVLATYDTITDFSANTYGAGASGAVTNVGANGVAAADLTGDLIDLTAVMNGGVTGIDVLVTTNAADAQTFLQNTGTAGTDTGIALDSSSNLLYIDLDSNGTVDSVIKLAGVTTIDEAAFIF